jgi:hypothetical protein
VLARATADDVPRLAGYVGLAGVVCLLAGLLLRRAAPATVGLTLVGAGYGISLAGRALDPGAPLVAGAFLLVAELAYWALEPGASVRIGRRATLRRMLFSIGLATGAVVLAALLLGVASAPQGGGASLGIAGVAAIAAIVGVVFWLVHTLRPA